MSDQQFMDITGATKEEAKFFLEASNDNLELAISSYFNSKSTSSPQDSINQPKYQPSEGVRNDTSSENFQSSSGNSGRSIRGSQKQTSRFATLSDFNQPNNDDQQKYYAGGSETSGQQILGGSSGKQDMVSEIIRKAKEAHARGEVPQPIEEKFSGHGQRLGSQRTSPTDVPLSKGRQKYKKVKITFYEDGFTFDDGEFRPFTEPKNQEILEAIHRGYIPQELSGGAETVDVELENRKHEKYTPPKFQAFKSEGRSLGGSSQRVSSGQSTTTPLTDYQCDRSQPYTTLQLRLPSGAVRQEFNLSDTIQTVKNFIAGREQQLQQGDFTLVLAIPPRTELTDTQQTLQEAGLQNTALMIKK